MTATTDSLKIKGRKLFAGDREIAEIRGYREIFRGEAHGEFSVWQADNKVASGFCYFADAVKWAKAAYRDRFPEFAR